MIVNVTSSVTLFPHALLSVYTASKAAVNAFSEVLALELKPFNIRVKVAIPGQSSDTQFAENAKPRMANTFTGSYSEFAKTIFAGLKNNTKLTYPHDIAEAIWLGSNDKNSPLRIVAGADAKELWEK